MKFDYSLLFRRPQKAWLRYVLAIAGTGAALALRGLLDPALGNYVPYLTVFPAVIFAAWYCGLWPSVISAILSSLGEIYWYIEPRHSFGISAPAETISLAVYLMAAAAIVAFAEANKRSMARAYENLIEARTARNLFQKFMDHSPAAAYMKDEHGRYLFYNKVFENHLNVGQALLGKTDAEFFPATERLRMHDAEVLETGKSIEFVENEAPDTAWLTSKFLVVDESGRRFVCGISMDITERNRFEEALRKTHDELEIRVQERTRELARRNHELAEQTEVVRELSTRLLEMRDQERRHIARELHDGIGQIVAAMKMNLARVAAESKTLSQNSGKAVAETISLTDQLSSDIRTLSHLLHPPLLDELGLTSALRWYVEGFAERSKILVKLELPQSSAPRLPRELEMHLFRIVQECLTNIHRHSGSATATVAMTLDPGRVRIEVADQGKGIPVEKQSRLQSNGRVGIGISGMRERVKQFGGNLEITSGPDGTVVTADLPLETTVSPNRAPSDTSISSPSQTASL